MGATSKECQNASVVWPSNVSAVICITARAQSDASGRLSARFGSFARVSCSGSVRIIIQSSMIGCGLDPAMDREALEAARGLASIHSRLCTDKAVGKNESVKNYLIRNIINRCKHAPTHAPIGTLTKSLADLVPSARRAQRQGQPSAAATARSSPRASHTPTSYTSAPPANTKSPSSAAPP